MSHREELIERVTKEVMKIYNVAPSTVPVHPPTVPSSFLQTGSAPVAEKKQEKIQIPEDCSRFKALILTCGNSSLIPETIAHFKELKSKYRQVKVLMSENAKEIFSKEKTRPFAGYEYIIGDGEVSDLNLFDHFYLINPTINTLSKISLLQADNLPSMVARRALMWNKPVVICLDQIPTLPEPMMDEFSLIIEKLVKFGFDWKSPRPVRKIVAPRVIEPTNLHSVTGHDQELASYIDHTLLKADATLADHDKLCEEAARYGFFSVCVNPGWISYCKSRLKNTTVKVCTVIGFPLGANTPELKAFETQNAIQNGADEVDMVINIGALKSKNYELVKKDIETVVAAAGGLTTKVILETSLLSREEIIIGCRLSKEAKATFVKTSTGFSTGGATAEHIRLMRNAVGPEMGVKASGGVRDTAFAKEMIRCGATRIGASASVAIVTGKNAGAGKY